MTALRIYTIEHATLGLDALFQARVVKLSRVCIHPIGHTTCKCVSRPEKSYRWTILSTHLAITGPLCPQWSFASRDRKHDRRCAHSDLCRGVTRRAQRQGSHKGAAAPLKRNQRTSGVLATGRDGKLPSGFQEKN